jgi:hypothetical protein
LTTNITRVIFPSMDEPLTYTAFVGPRRLASGELRDVLLRTKKHLDRDDSQNVLLFEDQTGRQVDFDPRGTPEQVVERAIAPERTGPGRPKLGVVSREVSLLPRHWEWLEAQPAGISAALRRLVDDARKREPGRERARLAREATSRFLTAMAGDRPGYEEATRALFAGDGARFRSLVRRWPKDVREHAERMAAPAFDAAP